MDQNEYKLVQLKAKKWGLGVEEYIEMLSNGTFERYKANVSLRRSRYKAKVARLKNKQYKCPICRKVKKSLDDWPQHASYCKDCGKTGRMLASVTREKKKKDRICAICYAEEGKDVFERRNGVLMCRVCVEYIQKRIASKDEL